MVEKNKMYHIGEEDLYVEVIKEPKNDVYFGDNIGLVFMQGMDENGDHKIVGNLKFKHIEQLELVENILEMLQNIICNFKDV